ncbi:MAG: sulfatase-like hydrolase/transferase [Selenomonadaceae bacterium]|nr:sulfatase-like hydrolase/transferase [Selenomonadaceae bacterium]
MRRFFSGLQRDFRLFLFILLLLEIYRAAFIYVMSDYIGAGTDSSQIWLANFAGIRLSLKTAGVVTLLSFVFVTLAGLTSRLRLAIGIIASLIFSILFMARFPYYREFNATFGMALVQGLQDDLWSIIVTLVQGYGIIWRLPVAFLLTIVCIFFYSRLLLIKPIQLPDFETLTKKVLFMFGSTLIIVAFFIFARFGGSFTYENGLNWENAGITSDEFLNECILDDGQALYRAYSISRDMKEREIAGVEQDKILEYAEFISQRKNLNAQSLEPYLERTAGGSKIDPPKHIFIIMGETWMQWPMLGKYADLHIADGIKSLIAEPNCYYSRNFFPTGSFTSIAVDGIVTGMPDVNININYQPRTYEEIYISAMAPPLKELGYRVDFWYGGTPSWDNISKMALAQGFDNFYGYPDLNAPKQTTWGAKDGDLFDAIERHLPDEPPTVHLIMTTTNHPPYNLDLAAEGYNLAATLAELEKLPNVDDARSLAVSLGHYWYMDKVTTKFIRSVSEKYPDSLFIVTGDHAHRTDPSSRPTIFEHESVPFVMYGAGIHKKILPPDVVGGHMSIVPTIIELIAPRGFIYYSIAPSLFNSFGVAFDLESYITQNTAGRIDSDVWEILPQVASVNLPQVNLPNERKHAMQVVRAVRTVAWWLLTKGPDF